MEFTLKTTFQVAFPQATFNVIDEIAVTQNGTIAQAKTSEVVPSCKVIPRLLKAPAV